MGAYAINQSQVDALQERGNYAHKRKCASCGRPTTDYRCDACWNKLRGEGDQGEGRKRNPLTNTGLQLDPWKPLTALPTAFVSDRQAEFFARQAAQKAKQEEVTMNKPEAPVNDAPRNYTVKELAALAGVRAADVYDARRNQSQALLSTHSGRGRVVACMQEHGISWAQVQGRTAVAKTAAPGADGGAPAPALTANKDSLANILAASRLAPACVPAEQPVNKNSVEDIARRLDALFAGVSLETAAKASAAALTRIGVNKNPGEVVVIRSVQAYQSVPSLV